MKHVKVEFNIKCNTTRVILTSPLLRYCSISRRLVRIRNRYVTKEKVTDGN